MRPGARQGVGTRSHLQRALCSHHYRRSSPVSRARLGRRHPILGTRSPRRPPRSPSTTRTRALRSMSQQRRQPSHPKTSSPSCPLLRTIGHQDRANLAPVSRLPHPRVRTRHRSCTPTRSRPPSTTASRAGMKNKEITRRKAKTELAPMTGTHIVAAMASAGSAAGRTTSRRSQRTTRMMPETAQRLGRAVGGVARASTRSPAMCLAIRATPTRA